MNEPFRLLSRRDGSGSRLAVLGGDTLLEYYESEQNGESLVGAVLLGTAERVLPQMNAAFVRLGQRNNGFLPLREQESFHQAQGAAPVVTGRDVLVQVKKDAKGDKGAFLTRDLSFVGQYALLMPYNRFVGVSKRITDEEERARARRLGAALSEDRFGLIVRYAALYARPEDVRRELDELLDQWRETVHKAECAKAPALLYRPLGDGEAVLRDYAPRHPCRWYLCGEPPEKLPENAEACVVTPPELDALWDGAGVDRQLNAALKRRVPLRGGGDLVIDEREALHTIDLNSGSNVFAGEGDSLPFRQNLAAVPEIARQIRLRNLSGIILTDFIDMASDGERAQVLAAMEEALEDDRIKTVIHGFTSLGLLEMTRKRTRDTLRGLLTEPCKACDETGRVRARPAENRRPEG